MSSHINREIDHDTTSVKEKQWCVNKGVGEANVIRN